MELRVYAPSAAGYPALPKLKQAADIEGGDNFTFTPVKTVNDLLRPAHQPSA